MKYFLTSLLFSLSCFWAFAQNDFTGMAKYKMTVDGSHNAATDSMTIIFSKTKIKLILYLPDLKRPGAVAEKVFIDDFKAKKSIVLDNEQKTYRIDTLNAGYRFDFVNSNSIASCNNLLCFTYKADSLKLDRSTITGAECLASIDYRNESVRDYFFLGIQPVIIDNRIVMDYTVTQPNGVKQRIYIYDIKRIEEVDSYFNLAEYRPLQSRVKVFAVDDLTRN